MIALSALKILAYFAATRIRSICRADAA